MWGLSRGLTDAQIGELAKYFSAQPARPNAPGDATLAKAGHEIFDKGIASAGVPACSSCHGPEGHGAEAFPRLAGQHGDYVVKQLDVFRNTEQRPEGAVMKVVSHSLTPQDIRAVAAYVQGLR
jgi:Cytochrome c553